MTGPLAFPSIFDDPDYRRQRVFDMIGGLGAGLIRASQPGMANDWGSLAAGALGGAAMGGLNTEDRFLRRQLTNAQVQKARQDFENDRAWASMFKGPIGSAASAPPVASAPAAPSVGAPPPNRDQFVQMMTPHAMAVSQATGLDPRLVIAQAALETGYGRSAPGNNYFGIKGPGQELATMEAGAGGLYPTRDSFRTYADPAASATDYANLLKTNSRYAPVLAAQGLDAQIDAMGKSGYATDPQYGAKLRQIALGLPQGGGVQVAQAGGVPVVPQGDAVSGQGDAPAPTALPPAMRPQTMQDVINTMPPGVRQLVGAMGRKEGLPLLLKYADPGSEAVVDTQSGQVVFIPKTMVGRDPRYQPVEGERLNIERRRIQLDASNKPVTEAGSLNEPYIEAQRRIQSAQGNDPASKITEKLAEDAIKRSNDWQASGLKAQSNIGRLSALQSMLDQISTNQFKGTTAQLKAAAKAAGMDLEAMGIKDDVGVTQAAQALTNLLALENRDPSGGAGMPGAMSDADRAFLQQAGPSITKDPAGNRILIAIKKGDLQRQIDIAKYASEYKRSKAFKDDPAGLDEYVAGKIAGRDYYDSAALPQQSIAPPGAIPSQAPAMRRYNPATGKIE